MTNIIIISDTHTSSVEKLTDNECLHIAALLHDIGTYLGFRGKHALTSAKFAKEFLEKYHCLELQVQSLLLEPLQQLLIVCFLIPIKEENVL